VPAKAVIDGDTIVVESPQVAQPAAVRFGWHQLAEPNLCNQAGLPASPFRTDRWSDAVNAEPAATEPK
jgi:sialate O-acetylesterase